MVGTVCGLCTSKVVKKELQVRTHLRPSSSDDDDEEDEDDDEEESPHFP